MKTEVIIKNLKFTPNIWELIHSEQNTNEFHLVFQKKYTNNIVKLFNNKVDPNLFYCWVGIHKVNSEVDLCVDMVYTDKAGNNRIPDDKVFKYHFRRPINLSFNDQYKLDDENNQILDKKNNDITNGFLEIAYQDHIKATKLLSGFSYRFKLWKTRYLLKNIFAFLTFLGRHLLRIISGQKIVSKTAEEIHFHKLIKKNIEINKVEGDYSISFMNISANAYSAATYSFLHLLLAFVYIVFEFKISFISKIMNSTFLSIAYVVLTIFLWEKVIPKLLLQSIEKNAKRAYICMTRSIKV